MIADAQVLEQMRHIVSAMSLAIYQGTCLELSIAEVWAIQEQGCEQLAELAELAEDS